MTIRILGKRWKIEKRTAANDEILERADGYVDWTRQTIVIRDPDDVKGELGDMDRYWKKVLRHEIVHAFLFESGLGENSLDVSAWAKNEEMIDWIAYRGPEIYKAWESVGAL